MGVAERPLKPENSPYSLIWGDQKTYREDRDPELTEGNAHFGNIARQTEVH
jgi:hypothetical protein